MRRALRLLVLPMALSAPGVLCAQSAARTGGPEQGTWAAEASVGASMVDGAGQGASVLRFISPATALVGGFSFSRTDFQSRRISESGFLTTAGTTTIALQAGVRRYGRTGLGLRPVFGGGVLFSRRSIWEAYDENDVGGYGEAGAAWFFNPHVSLGAIGALSAVKKDNGWSFGGTLARLTGAVYF